MYEKSGSTVVANLGQTAVVLASSYRDDSTQGEQTNHNAVQMEPARSVEEAVVISINQERKSEERHRNVGTGFGGGGGGGGLQLYHYC